MRSNLAALVLRAPDDLSCARRTADANPSHCYTTKHRPRSDSQLEILDELELSIESGLSFAADMMDYGAHSKLTESAATGASPSHSCLPSLYPYGEFRAPAPRARAELHNSSGCVFKISKSPMEVRENPIGAAWRMVRVSPSHAHLKHPSSQDCVTPNDGRRDSSV